MVRLRSRPRRPRWQMTTRSRVAVVLGVAGLGVAVAQALLLSSPPTWFQIAVIVFWGVVGTAYLASGLGQQWRDRLRPSRHRVPDGELSTGGPGGDADVVRRDDVGDGNRPGTPRARREAPVDAGGADVGPGETTAVVPPVASTPVRAARARGAHPGAGTAVPVPPGPAAPSYRRVPAPVAAGRPAPPSLSPAPAGPVPPPTAAETTAARVSPWPLAATSVPPTVPAPARTAPARAAAARTTPAGTTPAGTTPARTTPTRTRTTLAPVPAVPAPPAPVAAPPAPAGETVTGTTVTPGPKTSPSFAIRHAAPGLSFGRRRPAAREHTSGRHAVPDEAVADEIAPRRHRHRRPTDTLEQPAVGASTPTRRHRAPRRRAG